MLFFFINAVNNKKRIDKEKAESARQSIETAKAMEELRRKTDVHLETGSVFEPVVLDIDEDGNIRH